ncbi:MAG: ABC transporter substrate-binding protein [Chloroflexota bacterium]
MTKYLIRRLIIAVPTLLGISLILFVILSLAPGDPFSELALNPNVPVEVRENLRRQLGMDDPVHIRYIKWLTSLLQGNLGYSFVSRVDVTQLIWQRLPTTIFVMGTAYIVALLIALPAGIISAVRQYSWLDNVATTLAFIGFSLPTFFTGLIFILVFSIYLRWLPMVFTTNVQATGPAWFLEVLRHAAMPIMVLALFEGAVLTRYIRASMLDVIRMDYIHVARAKGLSERAVIVRHALRNALIPVVTIMALQIPGIFTGAIVTEQIFRVPGIGSLLISSIQLKDTPVVMAIVFAYAVLVVVFNLIADLAYGVLDPRIRYD